MSMRKALRCFGHLSWLRFGVRNRIIRYFHDPDTSTSEEFRVPFFGGTYCGNFDTFIDWSTYYYGAYEREELRLIEDFLATIKDPVFLDIGANVGHHTLFAAMRSKRVLAFEPFQDVSERLEQKIDDNNLTNVQLFRFGLGYKNEFAEYVKPTGNNTGTGSFISSGDKRETLSLQVRKGDDVMSELGIEMVHFIKIDTEGYEPSVLSGLKNSLLRCRPLVFFEWSQGEKQLASQSPPAFFPEEYRFYEFVSDTVVFGIFRKPTYRLVPLIDRWPDGNLFAVPHEYIERLRMQSKSSAAWDRLTGQA